MTDPPLCRCHGEPMQWKKDKRSTAGGYWRCIVKLRAAWARYDSSPKGRRRKHRYNNSPPGVLSHQLHDMARVRVRY